MFTLSNSGEVSTRRKCCNVVVIKDSNDSCYLAVFVVFMS